MSFLSLYYYRLYTCIVYIARKLAVLCVCHNRSVGCAVEFISAIKESRLVTIEVESRSQIPSNSSLQLMHGGMYALYLAERVMLCWPMIPDLLTPLW
jgi:hypothetical protein